MGCFTLWFNKVGIYNIIVKLVFSIVGIDCLVGLGKN